MHILTMSYEDFVAAQVAELDKVTALDNLRIAQEAAAKYVTIPTPLPGVREKVGTPGKGAGNVSGVLPDKSPDRLTVDTILVNGVPFTSVTGNTYHIIRHPAVSGGTEYACKVNGAKLLDADGNVWTNFIRKNAINAMIRIDKSLPSHTAPPPSTEIVPEIVAEVAPALITTVTTSEFKAAVQAGRKGRK